MQRLEVSGAVRPIYGSLGVKRLILFHAGIYCNKSILLLYGLPSEGHECWQQTARNLLRYIEHEKA